MAKHRFDVPDNHRVEFKDIFPDTVGIQIGDHDGDPLQFDYMGRHWLSNEVSKSTGARICNCPISAGKVCWKEGSRVFECEITCWEGALGH